MFGRCVNPIYRDHDACARLPEASVPRLRKFLLPVELAEAELKATPAAAVMVLLREGPRGLEVLFGERRKREGDPWSGQVGLPGGRHHDEDGTLLSTAIRETRGEAGIDLNGRAEGLGHMGPRRFGGSSRCPRSPTTGGSSGDSRIASWKSCSCSSGSALEARVRRRPRAVSRALGETGPVPGRDP